MHFSNYFGVFVKDTCFEIFQTLQVTHKPGNIISYVSFVKI